jgi:hypothetical protein
LIEKFDQVKMSSEIRSTDPLSITCACANIRREYSPDSPTFAKPCCADSPDSPTFANLFGSDSPNSPKFASGFARTRQTRRNLPKAIFEKNVTRLAKFAGVIRETRANFASSHCLVLTFFSSSAQCSFQCIRNDDCNAFSFDSQTKICQLGNKKNPKAMMSTSSSDETIKINVISGIIT